MTSVTDICNQALLSIGAQAQVSRINPSDGSTEGDACSIFYTPKIQALHRVAHWNFARKQANLTQLKAAVINGVISTNPPPIPWLYEYAYPEDCLKVRYIMPYLNPADSFPVPLTTGIASYPILQNTGAVPFVVGTDLDANGSTIRVILTNAPQAMLVYTADYSQNPDLWDAHFQSAASTYLASWLVNALARNRDLWRDQMALVKDVVDAARVSDGNETFVSQNREASWITARGALGASNWYFDNLCYVGWDSCSFPSGAAF